MNINLLYAPDGDRWEEVRNSARISDFIIVSSGGSSEAVRLAPKDPIETDAAVVVLDADHSLDPKTSEQRLRELRRAKKRVFVEVTQAKFAELALRWGASGVIASNVVGGPFRNGTEASPLLTQLNTLKGKVLLRIQTIDETDVFPDVDGVVIDLLPHIAETYQTTSSGKTITLIGTSHTSSISAKNVVRVIHTLRPTTVCLELPEDDEERGSDLETLIKESAVSMMVTLILFEDYQQRIADHSGTSLGADMQAATEAAYVIDANVVHIDLDSEITLNRVWWNAPLWQRVVLFGAALTLRFRKLPDEPSLESMKEDANMEAIVARFAHLLPDIKHVMIDERDLHMAQRIRAAPGTSVVAVVGLGHLRGIRIALEIDAPDEHFQTISSKPLIPYFLRPGALVGFVGSRFHPHIPGSFPLLALVAVDLSFPIILFVMIFWRL